VKQGSLSSSYVEVGEIRYIETYIHTSETFDSQVGTTFPASVPPFWRHDTWYAVSQFLGRLIEDGGVEPATISNNST
jgi:hypothetical protein